MEKGLILIKLADPTVAERDSRTLYRFFSFYGANISEKANPPDIEQPLDGILQKLDLVEIAHGYRSKTGMIPPKYNDIVFDLIVGYSETP